MPFAHQWLLLSSLYDYDYVAKPRTLNLNEEFMNGNGKGNLLALAYMVMVGVIYD